MTLNKSRGSLDGLRRYQAQARESARTAISKVITRLAIEVPTEIWPYCRICQLAGLSSAIALKKPWNADLLATVREHNSTLAQKKLQSSIEQVESSQKEDGDRDWRAIVKKLKVELAKRDAELVSLQIENRKLYEKLHKRAAEHRSG